MKRRNMNPETKLKAQPGGAPCDHPGRSVSSRLPALGVLLTAQEEKT